MFSARDFVAPSTLEEAYELNQKRANRIIGGMCWVRMSNSVYGTLIDISKLGLDKIEEDEDGFKIGAMVTLRDTEIHEGLNKAFCNVPKECVRSIVGVQFRNLATIGGSIWSRFGFSDLLTAYMALGASVDLYKGGRIPMTEFANMKPDNDILTGIYVPKRELKAAYKTIRNTKTDIPVMACALCIDENGTDLAVGARPAKAKLLHFEKGTAAEVIIEKCKSELEYGSNLRAGKEYRQHTAGVLTGRLLEEVGYEY